MGIEPTPSAWEAEVLPLNYTRVGPQYKRVDVSKAGVMKRKEYEKALRELHGRLSDLQSWVRAKGQRIIIVFEGRDAAGKGGCIRALTERVSPRVFRVVALPAPSDREKTQVYLQRYITHFPAAGEIVIFDRSWYNRAGVERVMGFCTDAQHQRFLRECPVFEKGMIVDSGIHFFKYWLEVSDVEQEKRFRDRIDDPRKQWKLSPIDLPSRERWYEYSRARDEMFEKTDLEETPWHIVNADDKYRARLNLISHFLDSVPYEAQPHARVELPERDTSYAYDDRASMRNRRYVPSRF